MTEQQIRDAVDAGRLVCNACIVYPIKKIDGQYVVTGLANNMTIDISRIDRTQVFVIDESSWTTD